MITEMKFKKLFGRFDYVINLKQEGITIITGPNGYGKSTILRCIKALHDGDIQFFAKLDFIKIEIGFSNLANKFIIEKNEKNLQINEISIPIELCDKLNKDFNLRQKYYFDSLFEHLSIVDFP